MIQRGSYSYREVFKENWKQGFPGQEPTKNGMFMGLQTWWGLANI
jgi:hypothetical protein